MLNSSPRRFLRRLQPIAWLVALLLIGWGSAKAQASERDDHDGVIERRWLDDPSGTLSPQAALAGDWKPFQGSLSRGYTLSTTWLRLKIDPDAAGPASIPADHRLVLAIAPGHLDEIAVFRVDRLSAPPLLVGDTHRMTGAQQSLLHYSVVYQDASEPFEVLLRVRSKSNHSMLTWATRWDEAHSLNLRQHGLVIAYLVFTAMVLLVALIFLIGNRDVVLALFIFHQIAALILAVTMLGVLRLYCSDWISSSSSDLLTSLAIPFFTCMGVLFHSALLADVGANRVDVSILRGTTVIPAAAMLLIMLGQVRWGLLVAHVFVPCVMLLIIAIVCRIRPGYSTDSHPASHTARRAYLIGVYVAMTITTMPQSMRVLGFISASSWTYGGFLAYGLIDSLLLGSLLVYRSRETLRRQAREHLALEISRREAHAQRMRTADQSELMTMLTHELKTPLSVVSLALGPSGGFPGMRERGMRAVENMRDVINRCMQVAIVDDQIGRHDAAPMLASMTPGQVLLDAVDMQLGADCVDVRVNADLFAVLADRQMLLIIFSNLLENALKYGPAGGRVQVSAERAMSGEQAGVTVRVANRIGPAGRPDASHLFEKFYRGSYARHRSGSGLGLYLSRRLAYRLGGTLVLVDGDGDEVVFELWLPADDSSGN